MGLFNEDMKIGDLIFKQDELKFKIQIGKNDIFIMRAPTIRDKAAIIAARDTFAGNVPVGSLMPEDFANATACANVHILLEEWPDWFKGVGEAIDQELINNIYAGYMRQYEILEKKLKKNRYTG